MTIEMRFGRRPSPKPRECVPPGPSSSVGLNDHSGAAMHDVGTTSGQLDARWTETLDGVRAFVGSRVGNAELADDITQDVFTRSIARGDLDEVENPTAWLYRSARNAVIDHYRTRRVHEQLNEIDLWPEPEDSGAQPNEATRELARCLLPLLLELPPSARDALVRIDLDGQTHQQAAAQLGISVSGMKSRVQRARRQLKAILERCCAVQLDGAGAISSYQRSAPCGCESTTPCAAP